MFLMFASIGCWVPLFPVRLEEIDFTPEQIALASSMMALAYLAAPLGAGQFADRWIPAEHCIAGGGVIAGVLLLILADLEEPAAVTWTCLAFWLVMVPVLTVGSALTFSHTIDPARHFGHPAVGNGRVGGVGVAGGRLVAGWAASVVPRSHRRLRLDVPGAVAGRHLPHRCGVLLPPGGLCPDVAAHASQTPRPGLAGTASGNATVKSV